MTEVLAVDGSNTGFVGRSKAAGPSAVQLEQALKDLHRRFPSAEILVVVDASFPHRLPKTAGQREQERAALTRLHSDWGLRTTPPGTNGKADRFLAALANERIAAGDSVRLVSHDSFAEMHADFAWLLDEDRFLRGHPLEASSWYWDSARAVRRNGARGVARRRREDETVRGTDLAATSVEGRQSEVWRVRDGGLEHRWFHSGWSPWTSMEIPDGETARGVGAGSHGDWVDLFLVARPSGLLHRWWSPWDGWSNWHSWAAEADSVAVTSAGPDHIEVFWTAQDHAFHQWFGSDGWSAVTQFD